MLKLRHMLATASLAVLALAGSTATSAAGIPSPTAGASIDPAGQTVGVAHPITVTFDHPVRNRTAVEQSIDVSSPDTPDGTITWLSDRELQWNPTRFWPAHSTITVTAGNTKASFQTGASVVSVADIDAHTFTVSIDGEVAREMPASMGKAKFPTPTGTFRVLGKEDVVIMDSRTIGIPLDDPEGYKLTVYDAVRITWGGVYVHGAPWSTGSQGYANVSHGCINLSPDNADWYYNTVGVGDPVIVQA
ncbi:Lipoprotein-anchoring transpeptidase ErfK/SrfK [Mycolicibacterium rutilum]|uniref:Lipoprotein-anchoring transpeptidase ErfK/SrfK n=2 Tax=Mycolicibacterium rutilum TaxID=370526 RepID=A0A1H6KQK9_MYCRU|nr:Lipoprotein-anchoring transpeptidase ErfK/SrfK [Mycolicibacterium rutilum]